MNPVYASPEMAWQGHMQDLLQAPRHRLQQYSLHWQVPELVSREPAAPIRECINQYYPAGRFRGCDQILSFTDWNMNKIFPLWLYQEHNEDLPSMLEDPRFTHVPAHSKTDNWSSIFGRLGTTRASHRISYLQYFLERWQQTYIRGLPIFHFDIEGAEYTLAPMINNPRILKHQRIATSCIMGVSYKYEGQQDTLFMSILMRANQWSHTYGDIFSGSYMGTALCKAVGISRLQCCLFMPSTVLDEISLVKSIQSIYKEHKNV